MTPEGRRAKDDETGIYVDLPGLVALRHAAAGIADMPSRPGRNLRKFVTISRAMMCAASTGM